MVSSSGILFNRMTLMSLLPCCPHFLPQNDVNSPINALFTPVTWGSVRRIRTQERRLSSNYKLA